MPIERHHAYFPRPSRLRYLVLAYPFHSILFYAGSHQADSPFFSFSKALSSESFAASGPLHMPSPLENSSTLRLLLYNHVLKGVFPEDPIEVSLILSSLIFSIVIHYSFPFFSNISKVFSISMFQILHGAY